ncbi:MAG: type VI secretion system protein TssA [Azoarcus sp.]|jgi:type VI secretion system protein ImpA|nr:type VI secretion system protein TssA [Azoarcus sp.]
MDKNQDQALREKLEDLLSPVSDADPGGKDLQFLPIFSHIKEARRADDPSLPQGEWLTALKTAEWSKVIQLCEAALRSHSKDLQLAAWYVEALTHQDGYAGAAFGFRLIAGLLDRFWETLYPHPDPDGGLDERIGKLEWLDIQLERVLRELPLVSPQYGGYDWYQWQASRETENLKRRDADAYEKALAAGALSGDAFDKSARGSGVIWFRELVAEIAVARAACDDLVRTLNERFGPDAPSLTRTCGALNDCNEAAQRFFGEFSGGALVSAARSGDEGASSGIPAPLTTPLPPPSGETALVLGNRNDAIRQLRAVAYWFRSHEPHSPVALLIERAVQWAEMPFEGWLSDVIKDKGTLEQLRELLNAKIDVPTGTANNK